jgi:hypothetical protein
MRGVSSFQETIVPLRDLLARLYTETAVSQNPLSNGHS